MTKAFLKNLWRRITSGKRRPTSELNLGWTVTDGEVERRSFRISQARRKEHVAILGKTGTGKSSLLRSICAQDIAGDHGFVFFDLHGDATPFILRRVAAEERRTGSDLSKKLIVIDPADPDWSVGINVLEALESNSAFVHIAEFAELLRRRWRLDSLGPRTDELLRNSLFVLWENGLTLLDIGQLLTERAFRVSCMRKVRNPEVRRYFETRYEGMSEGMRRVAAEPILNKISAFVTAPHFRHIVGQQKSTISWRKVLESDMWVVINLQKGRLGEEAVTLGSLFLNMIKNALFSRQSHELFTLYCDEVQNLMAFDAGLDTILSESRKFGISVVSANQFLDQYPPAMRSAILAVGTHVLFQLASPDAQHMASALDGGKPLAELLKNLPHRHAIVKSGSQSWQEIIVPRIEDSPVAYSDLYDRCRKRWARRRTDIEKEITNKYVNPIDAWR